MPLQAPILYGKNTINVIDDSIIEKSLSAFTTGVGDKYDLKIFKQDISDYNNTFNLVGKIYGKYFKNISSYQKVKLNYRIKAIGQYEDETCQGYVKLKLSAITSDKVRVRVYRYATKNIDIKAKIECKVSYYEKIDTTWTPKSKTLTSEIFTSSLPVKASYTAKGNAILNTQNNVLMTSTPIKTIMWNLAMSDNVIKTSHDNGMTVQLFDYKIYDDYEFDTVSNRFAINKNRDFKLSQYGTVQVHTSSKVTNNLDSGLYMSGYSEGQLFECEKIFEKTITGNNNEVHIITKSDIENMIPKCVSDDTYLFDGNSSSIVTKIEILDIGPTITVTNNNINSDNIFSVTSNSFFETPVLTYKFNDITRNYFITTEDIFNNMVKDYNIKYKYSLNIIDCTSNIIMDSDTKLTPNYSSTWEDDYMSGFALEAIKEKVVLDWEYTYPEYPNEGFNGIVNAVNSLDGSYIKRDLLVQVPEIYVPQEMFDVKFKLITENISPSDSHLNAKFLNEDETGYTSVNGDFALFTSEATKPIIKEIKDIISIDTLETITLNDTTTKQFTTKVSKPILSISQDNLYTSYELNLETDSNDIEISDYNINLVFDENNECVIPYTCKVLRSSTSKWHPYIHNGYYYLNQDEYYLYSQSNISGNYTDNYVYKKKNVNYNINVELVNNKGESQYYNHNYQDKDDYNIIYSSNVEYNSKGLMPKPIFENDIYKEYKNTEHILPEISMPRKATSYLPLTYKLSKTGNEITVYGRAINENGVWSSWSEIENNTIPNIPASHKVQLKVNFSPVTNNVITDLEEVISNLTDFDKELDSIYSSNVTISNGYIECTSKNDNAIFSSKIFNYYNSTTIKLDTYYTCSNTNESYYLNIHVAGSDNYDEILYNPKWILMDGSASVTGKYIKYRIEFTKNIKVLAIYKYINTLVTTSTVQQINNISFGAEIDGEELVDTSINIDRISEISYNEKEHIVIDNVRETIEPMVTTMGYSVDNIGNITISTTDDDFEILTKENVVDFDKELISNIFEGYNRFSNYNSTYPAVSRELNYWVFDNYNKQIMYNYNSTSYVGLVTPQNYLSYNLKATLNSNAKTERHICVVLAYYKDYFGKEYTLSLLVSPGEDSYKVVYNYMQENQKTIKNGKDLVINNQDLMYWSQLGYGIRVDISRENNIFTIKRSQENEHFIDDNTLLEIDINNYPQLAIFKNGSSVGFGSYQIKSIFSNLLIASKDNANSSVIIKSKKTEIEYKEGENLLVTDNTINVSPFPQQYSPIIVSTKEFGELRRIFYRNEKGLYSLDIKESYYKNTNNCYTLTERNIDIKYLKVYINETLIKDFEIQNNIITLNSDYEYDYVVVEYRVLNSFVANYSYHSDSMEITLHTEKDIDNAVVKYETNLSDNRKELKNISLNPIYNTDSKGFIYISYEDNIINNINIHCNPKSVLANGIDSINLYFEALDELGNPVQNIELNSYAVSGTLIVENNITDQNGVVCAKYISCNEVLTDTIKVFESTNSISKEIHIYNTEV